MGEGTEALEGGDIYVFMTDYVVQQKPVQHYKAIILQFKKFKKNTVTELKNSVDSFNSRLDQVEEIDLSNLKPSNQRNKRKNKKECRKPTGLMGHH